MKYDARSDPDRKHLTEFTDWLLTQTIQSLKHAPDDKSAVRAAVFLFLHRAFEAHLDQETIGQAFGVAVVRAGFNDEQEQVAMDELGMLEQIIGKMYGYP